MTIRQRVDRCRAGLDPFSVAQLKSGWFCVSEIQPLGRMAYGILFHDKLPHGLNSLDREQQAQWGIDTATCGQALLNVLNAARINYETWGNVDPCLHTHITARFDDENPERRIVPPRQAYQWDTGLKLNLQDAYTMQIIVNLKDEFRKLI